MKYPWWTSLYSNVINFWTVSIISLNWISEISPILPALIKFLKIKLLRVVKLHYQDFDRKTVNNNENSLLHMYYAILMISGKLWNREIRMKWTYTRRAKQPGKQAFVIIYYSTSLVGRSTSHNRNIGTLVAHTLAARALASNYANQQSPHRNRPRCHASVTSNCPILCRNQDFTPADKRHRKETERCLN